MISERLRLALKEAKMSQVQLARLCGVKPPSVHGWLSGKAKFLRGENLLQAAQVLKVSQLWLATGKGPMRQSEALPGIGKPYLPFSFGAAEGYMDLDQLNIETAVGEGSRPIAFVEVVRRLSISTEWAHRVLGNNLGHIKLMTARGMSMHGTIENGDILFVDSSVRSYAGDGIYIISRDNELFVKRLEKLHGNRLAVISDNPQSRSEVLEAEETNLVIICGRVLASWSLKSFW